jgi:mono/diheme cytochrome c family protein
VWQGYPEGARNTPLLYNLSDYTLFNASGSWDEVADVELKIRDLMAGDGLIEGSLNPALGDPHSGLSPDLDTITAYLLTLQGPGSPPAADAALAARGREVFDELNCASCHVGDIGTDNQRYDVGTGGEFVTPTLRWLWLSAPYLHDGSAPTLLDLFIMPGAHQLVQTVPFDDITALVAYLNTLPTLPNSEISGG